MLDFTIKDSQGNTYQITWGSGPMFRLQDSLITSEFTAKIIFERFTQLQLTELYDKTYNSDAGFFLTTGPDAPEKWPHNDPFSTFPNAERPNDTHPHNPHTPHPELNTTPYLSNEEMLVHAFANQKLLIKQIDEAPTSSAEIVDNRSELRMKIRMALHAIVAAEKAETLQIERELNQKSTLGKVGAYGGAAAKGFGQAAWGLLCWAKEVSDLVNPVVIQYNLYKSARDAWGKDNFYDEFSKNYVKGQQRELVEAIGFDPSTITLSMLTEAFEIVDIVMSDPALQIDLKNFAKDYAGAQHSLEITEFGGGAVFEVVLTIVMTALTGGVGAVAAAGSKSRLLGKFRKVGDLLKEFVSTTKKLLKRQKSKGAKGNSGGITKYSDLPSESAGNIGPYELPDAYTNPDSRPKKTNSQSSSANKADNPSDNAPDKTSDETGKNQNDDTATCNADACEGGEPINLKTGEERLTLVDATLDGPLPLTFARTYRSSNNKDFGLGHGWTHTFSEKLEWQQNATTVKFHDAEGRVIALPLPGPSGRSHNIVERLTLTRKSPNHWIITPYGASNPVQKHFKRSTIAGEYRLTELRDGYGNHHTFDYLDTALVTITSSLGDKLSFIPSEDARITTIIRTTADGQATTQAHYQYSPEGDLVQATDAHGHSEHYQYQHHVISQRTLKSGYNFYFRWDAKGPGARCIRQWGDPIEGKQTYHYEFDWDDDGKGVRVTDTRGGVEVYRFNDRALPVYHRDQEGGETYFTYNAKGQLTHTTLPENREESFIYDKLGRLIKKVDITGGQHTIEYDSEGLPTKVTNPAGHSWTRRYNEKGQITATEDALGNTTHYSYNPMGLIGSVTDALNHTSRYLWNNHGKLTAVNDPMGRTQHYKYDAAQRLTAIVQGKDQQGNKGQTTQYEYDDQDRICAITAPDGSTTQYRYTPHGQVAEIIDAQGRTTQYEYDGLSQVKRRINPNGTFLQYHYDGERNLVGLTNENGDHYQLKYDRKERLIEEIGFDGRITRYAYNKAGHLIQSSAVTNPQTGEGIHTQFERDPFGRLLKEITPDSTTQFAYNPSGQLIEAQNANRKLRWEYDPLGRVITDWQDDQPLHHNYDALGNRTQTQLPNGETLKYTFNKAGQFKSLHRSNATCVDQLLAEIQHDQQGREIHRHHGNGIESHRNFDPQGRLQQHRLTQAAPNKSQQSPVDNPTTNLQPQLLNQKQYQYNAAGQISQIDDNIRGCKTYHYDALDRLTQVQGPQPEHFIHDPAHNILANASSETDAQQQAQNTEVKANRLTFRGDTHYTYDNHGNRITAKRGKKQCLQTRYTYNSKQQLIKVEQSNHNNTIKTIQYQYDPLGRRIGKSVQEENKQRHTHFLWNGDVLLQEKTENTETGESQEKTYYFEPNTFKPVALNNNGKLYHYHLDHLGTPDTLTDQHGNIAWSVSYQTYGNVAIKHVNELEQPLRFQGQYHDEETGLYYNRFRYYDPSVGQFTQQDPIGLLGGINSYQYVPNPVHWVDPFGLTAKPGDCPKANSWNQFQKDTKGHFANSTEASKSYQRMEEVKAMDNVDRPNPSTYLPQSYIDAHEAKFAGGASYFAPKWALDKFGRNPVGRADGQFVMSKTQMDEVLTRTNGDMALIEKELGIPEGDWQGQEMVVIEISDPQKHNLRIPSGQEGGANELWLPGGKLPTGHDEAVTDAIPKGAFKEMSISDATKNAKKPK